MPYTLGFVNDDEWEDHWERHGPDFGAKSREEYLEQADNFLGSPKTGYVFEQKRPSDDEHFEEVVRFHSKTSEFGVLLVSVNANPNEIERYILTYFKPRPRRGTALDYYRRECLKRK